MKNKQSLTRSGLIENRIFTLRGTQVMLDSHLAELYNVETKVLNRAVKRNKKRFPETFMFQISETEWETLRFQIGTSKTSRGGRRYMPHAFTEQGVAMLSAILSSETAISVSIQIMQAFVQMRKFIGDNAAVFHRLDKVEQRQNRADEKFDRIFTALEKKELKPEKGIFFDGQIYDSYSFIAELIRNAGKSIILIDNFIDDTVLTLFIKRKKGVKLTIYTRTINKQLHLDISKHNAQYEQVQVKELKHAHDRFLIIDDTELYHIGASLKDLGKKWFAFSKMDAEALTLLQKLKTAG